MSAPGPAAKLRVCVAHSGQSSCSQTYIRAHIERLPCETIELYGGLPPVIHGKRRLLSASLLAKVWRHLTVAVMRWPRDRFQVRAIARFLKKEKVDVVLAEYGETAANLLDACSEAGVPLVAYFHGGDAYRRNTLERFGARYRRLFREAAALVVVSVDLQRQLVSLGAPPEKIFYNPCAVDRSRFAEAHPATAPPVFLAVGRFVEKKAPHLTLRAFRKTLGACPQAKLVMIGDGPLHEQCRYEAVAYDIMGAVDFRGTCTHEQVADAMRGARVFVQHSVRSQNGDSEGTPVAVLEAAASGLPVVATAHEGIRDVVEPGETGYLVAEGDVDAMAERMILLARDSELADRLGRNARQRLSERYDMEKNMQALHDILRAAARGVTTAAQDLFFAFCVPYPDAEAATFARAINSGDADRAALLALKYGLGGIFYRNMESAGLGNLLSPEIHEKLCRARAAAMKNGLARIQRFVDLSSALAKKGLRCVPLKGASLSMRTYPDEGCRATADLDVLIDPEGFAECARVLKERGYRVQTRTLRGVLQNHGQECTFIGLDGDEVDVHYRLFPWYVEKYIYKIDSAAMRSRIERCVWTHGEACFLKREDELHYLFLCAASGNAGFRYRLAADAFTRVHGAELDWDRIGAALFDSPMRKIHGVTAAFMAERLRTPFPDSFTKRAAAFRVGGAASALGAANLLDVAALTGLYLRWNIFKRSGLFKRYFLEHNNPVPAEFSW